MDVMICDEETTLVVVVKLFWPHCEQFALPI
jgi:hypothetical protein